MERKQIPLDDIEDIKEMSMKIEKAIAEILYDVDMDIAMSSLIGGATKCMLNQCEHLYEVENYQAVMNTCFNASKSKFLS